MSSSAGSGHRQSSYKNRLASEKSPYLLQHATNPVDWYPWGREAFEKAKSENKLIFLSVGYSTCHWCHVMEKESFEDEGVGKIMNDNFVSIKVDREERPDVDRVYMTFVQATTGHGGWPMSVWLTPDLKPVVGGTYFPPDGRYQGRPGFATILQNIASNWQNSQDKIMQQGTLILDALMKSMSDKKLKQVLAGQSCIEQCFSQLRDAYDEELGGFGKQPKFPQPVNLNFLLRKYAVSPESSDGQEAVSMVTHTLRMMAQGGIHDHVGQGFHRYSTDKNWHVPHFEKMLYDQGQLAVAYIDAYQISKDRYFADVAEDIFTYVNRDLSHKAGGFYSAEDADSLPSHDATEKKEGAFCVWTEEEVRQLIPGPLEGKEGIDKADVFCEHYSVQKKGNVDPAADPHNELLRKNVLTITGSVAETAEFFGLSEDEVRALLATGRQNLFEARKQRPSPHLDDKMLTSWNGLMLSGFARAGQVLDEAKYTERAIAAAEFIRNHLYNPETGELLRSCYTEDGEISQISTPISGFIDDYAFLIRGLLDLYETCYDTRWLEWAGQLQTKQDELFWDEEGHGYYSNVATDSSIVLRMKDDQDGAEPSGNSVSAMNLLRLASFLNRPEWLHQAVDLLKLFSERLNKIPMAVPEMVSALLFYHESPKQIVIVGDKDADDTTSLLRCVHSHFLPNKVIIVLNGEGDSLIREKHPQFSTFEKIEGKATAFVCENYTCQLPVTSVAELVKLLKQ